MTVKLIINLKETMPITDIWKSSSETMVFWSTLTETKVNGNTQWVYTQDLVTQRSA